MSWKHEEPLEEEATDGPTPQANPVENGSHEMGEAHGEEKRNQPVKGALGFAFQAY
ncbi:hypothetical protein L207DRAFT_511591 [Hyaloscypha variabilis F]|uniref:Uncharacterized protein n=1 Tax=Hyaloscypha variabilis (strain UAMH 11265 / GT02V1 / F) TaxID=1149755 RepID=A0A2J6RTF9_HYAVF|nr:hypothetical protein L207DRAFT_511591 [Hyaloscypha variabilis F]